MSDYQKSPFRFVNQGIDLHVAVDKVGEGKWLKMRNVRISQEGHITGRPGIDEILNPAAGTGVKYIKRLDDSTVLVLVGSTLYHNTTAYGTGSYTSPATLIPFKPKLGSAIWAYVGSTTDMRKVNAAGTDQKWGITRSSTACTASAGAAGNLDSSVPGAVGYDWRQTFYSDTTGAESNPSDVQTSLTTLTAQIGSVTTTTSADGQVTDIRLYRRGGTLPDTWRYVGDFPNTVGPHSDNVSDATLALNEALVTTNDVPFTSVNTAGATVLAQSMPYLWGPFVGKYIMGCGDANRPGYVYWTNPGQPDGADPANSLSVTPPTEPLLGGFVYNGSAYTYSRENIYELVFGGPNSIPTFIGRKTPVGRGVAQHNAVAVGPLVSFLGDDGIYATDCSSPAQSITDESMRPMFRFPTGQSTGEILYNYIDYDITTHCLVWAGHELWFVFKDTTGHYQTWIYDAQGERWRTFDTTIGETTVAADDVNKPYGRVLFDANNGKIYSSTTSGLFTNIDPGATSVVSAVMTGFLDMGKPTHMKQFGNIVVDAVLPNAATITVKVRINGRTGGETVTQTSTITGDAAVTRKLYPIALLSGGEDIFARNISFEFTWTQDSALPLVTIYGFDLLWRPDAEALEHWEFPETAHGLSGWQFLRDGYLMLNSSASSTLTVTIDGTAHNYTVLTTSGEPRKVYVPMEPAKGKVFKYRLNTNSVGTPFYLYGDECEMRLKQWNTSLDYRLITPFGRSGGGE